MLLSVGNNINNWFSAWHHILGLVLVFVVLLILFYRQYFKKKHNDKFTFNTDLAFKISAFLVSLIACLLSIL